MEQRAHSEALHPRWPGKASSDVFRGLSRALQQILRTLCPTKHIATQLSGMWIGVAGEQRRNRWFRKLLPSKLSQFAAYGRLERSALRSAVFICKICERLICESLPRLVEPLSPTFLLQNRLHCWTDKRVSVVFDFTFL